VSAVAISADGRYAASGGGGTKTENEIPIIYGTNIVLWDVKAARSVGQLIGHTGVLRALAFSPDSKFLASAGGTMVVRNRKVEWVDCTVRLWDVRRRKEICRFEGHERGVTSVVFLPDGQHLLSADLLGKVKLWALNAEGEAVPAAPGKARDPATLRRSELVGVTGGKAFDHNGGEDAFLVGVSLKGNFDKNRGNFTAIDAIYGSPAGTRTTNVCLGQEPRGAIYKVQAKDGYAVGGMMLHDTIDGFHAIRGIKLQYMRRKDGALDPKDSYWSDWIGLPGDGKAKMLGGDGKPVVGVYGSMGLVFDGLGIIQLR
jgi:hypothetical protein